MEIGNTTFGTITIDGKTSTANGPKRPCDATNIDLFQATPLR
jgi:hypothetical protein